MYEAQERAHLVSSILPWLRSEIGKVNHLGWINKNPAQFLYNFSLDIFGRALTIVAPGIFVNKYTSQIFHRNFMHFDD